MDTADLWQYSDDTVRPVSFRHDLRMLCKHHNVPQSWMRQQHTDNCMLHKWLSSEPIFRMIQLLCADILQNEHPIPCMSWPKPWDILYPGWYGQKLRCYKHCQSSSPGVRCHLPQPAGESGLASPHSACLEGGAAWRAGVHPYQLGAWTC